MAAIEKTYISANEYQIDIWKLASQIRKSGWKPDFLIGLWRGGAPVAISVHEFLKATGWSVEHLPLKCFSYTGIKENCENVSFFSGDAVFGMFKKGDKVLFVDDVFDTGKTAAAVHEKALKTGIEMKLACVYWKSTENKTSLKPDFCTREIGGKWIVFPHEMVGLTMEEIRRKNSTLAELLP